MLSRPLIDKVQDILFHRNGLERSVASFVPVPGGSINQAYSLDTGREKYFLKLNEAKRFPGMFEAEEKGLKILKENSTFKIPDVLIVDYLKEEAFILMEFIEKGHAGGVFHTRFGMLLAEMHRQSDASFGLEHDNYIGSLTQSNTKHASWTEFFISERMEKQLKLAVDKRAISREMSRAFERLYARLGELMPVEAPALLHGDLWSGNYMAAADGTPCIFDPAVYYGHREMDIAMTKLFGGFPADFYNSYHEHYTLEKGWEKRLDIFQLYPLLVHVNLFGGSYAEDVKRIVSKF